MSRHVWDGAVWGAVIDHPTMVQSHGQLQYLIGSLCCNDTTVHIIHMFLEYKKLEYGCSSNVLEQEYDRYSGAIIDKKLDHGNMVAACPTQLESASDKTFDPGKREYWRCRDHGKNHANGLYLRVFFLSGIADLPGTHVEAWFKKGQRQ
jgi:hypothetical protein